jgi:putative pyruvate formate lyase activating enzyme
MPGQLISVDRLEMVHRHDRSCHLCQRHCGANRLQGEKGPCLAGVEARVFRHRVECGEELELIPSHLFYLSGCDLRCAFCIAGANAMDPRRGRPLDGEFLAKAIAWGRQRGARNLQWVGGEPTIHLAAILEAMAQCPDLPPVVWKSDFHGSTEAMDLLKGLVDVYVADFKFGNDQCARAIARVNGYVETVTRNLLLAEGQADLIVRHLLLPGHFDCCYRPVVDWMRRNLPRAKFSIRDGYLPAWQAGRRAELSQPLDAGAGRRARALAQDNELNIIT